MKIKPILLLAFFATTGCAKEDAETPAPAPSPAPVETVLYLIRHAETTGIGADPNLSPIGLQRADDWAALLQDVAFAACYSTNYNRTRQTAEPTATSNGQVAILYDPADLTLADVVADHTGGNVFIVGHSNTTPEMVNAYLGSNVYPDMAETEHGHLYKVTVVDGVVWHELTVHN